MSVYHYLLNGIGCLVLVIGLTACQGAAGTPPRPQYPTPTPLPTLATLPTPDLSKIPPAAIARGFLLLNELHRVDPAQPALMAHFLAVVQADPQPIQSTPAEPLDIAFIFPSLEPSDSWARLNLTIRRRLDQLQIPYTITEYLTEVGAHQDQTAQIEQVINSDFDYVVIGPSEYQVQKENLARLAETVPTIVTNVVNPFVDTYQTAQAPIAYVGFDHSVGANLLCRWVIDETGGEGTFALVRYLPGLIDQQRSDVFADCLLENSNMTMVAEYNADGEREKAFVGANVILAQHPDITMIHAASTAVALGVLSAVSEQGKYQSIILNGWGGGADELTAIKEGGLSVTPFRVNDDWGVSVAEAIKLHHLGRAAKIPTIIVPTITLIDADMSAEEIAAQTAIAFRYSGDIE